MIEPIVFPHTFLDAATAGRLLACFNRIRVYVPTDSAAEELVPDVRENSRIDIRNPFSDSGLEVDRIFQEYRQWRQANKGTDISFFKASDGSMPFFNEDTVSYLRQDILRSVPGASEKNTDPLLTARVFLRMTGNYDRVQAEIDQSLLSQSEKERSMLAALRGDDDDWPDDGPPPAGSPKPPADPGGQMTVERLNAWALLAAEDGASPGIFLTPSRAVLTIFKDRIENQDIIFENIPIPEKWLHEESPAGRQWRNDLASFLADLTQRKIPDAGNADPPRPSLPKQKAGAFLTIICLPQTSARDFLARLCQNPSERSKTLINGDSATTLVAALLSA